MDHTGHGGDLHVNHRFLLDQVLGRSEVASGAGARILDYGCGGGAFVAEARRQRVEAFGADPFGPRTASREAVVERGLLGDHVREMGDDGALPFPDGWFTVVVSNQVFEHVDDLDVALDEVHRVLEPGGVLVALFPSRRAVREGHVGIPFLHWFPEGSRLRYAYALALRALGLGYHHGDRSRRAWVRDTLAYLDQHTAYRSPRHLTEALSQRFHVERIEAGYADYRLARTRRLRRLRWVVRLPGMRRIAGLLIRALAGWVIRAEKPAPTR